MRRTSPASRPGSSPAAAARRGPGRRPRRTGRRRPAPGTCAPARPAGDAEHGGDGGGGRGVRLVRAARQLEVDRPGGAVRVQDVVAAERPGGGGAAETALAAEPVVAGALHHAAARRARPGVVLPLLAGRHPHHVGGGGGGPHDERVVGVGDDDGLRAGEALAPLLGEHPGLGGAVELVAGEVEQRDHLGLGVPGHAGQVLLVHLDDAVLRLRPAGQRGGDARGHVRAERVGDDRAAGAQRLRDEAGRGGLAVGRRDQDDVQVLREPAQKVGVELQRHPAADHRSAAAARRARHRRCGPARRHGQLGARRQRLRVACHRPCSS